MNARVHHYILGLEERYPFLLQFVRYVIVGGSTALLELVIFLALDRLGVWYLLANIIAFGVAVLYGFVMQRRYTFRHTATDYHKQVVKFLTVMAFAFVLNNALIYLFIDVLHWQPVVAKCVQLFIVMLTNYAGQRWFTFRSHHR